MFQVDEATRAPEPGTRMGVPFEVRRLLRPLRRSLLAAGLVAVVGAVAGVTVAWSMPKEFVATAVLEYRGAAEPNQRKIQTLVSAVKIGPNLKRVRDRLRLNASLAELGSRVSARSERESNVFAVSGEADSADGAAALANAVGAAVLDHRRESIREELQEKRRRVLTSLTAARVRLVDAQTRYDDFRRDHGIAELPDETRLAIEEAAKLRAEAEVARVAADSEAARRLVLASSIEREASSVVVSETEVAPGVRRAAEVETELTAARGRLTEEHPRVRALAAELNALRSGHVNAARPERVVGRNANKDSLRLSLTESSAAEQAALTRRDRYLALASAARERVGKLSQAQAQAVTILAEARVARERVDEQALELAKVDDAIQEPEVDVAVVAPADAPMFPEPSSRRLVALAFPVLVFLMAVLARVLWEFRRLELTTPGEVAFWSGLPVAGTLLSLPEANDLATLAEGLAGDARTVTSLMVVPHSDEEAELATELAAALRQVARRSTSRRGRARLDVSTPSGAGVAALRLAARNAHRVVVVSRSGVHAATEYRAIADRLGRRDGVALVVVGLPGDYRFAADRVGSLAQFWQCHGRT